MTRDGLREGTQITQQVQQLKKARLGCCGYMKYRWMSLVDSHSQSLSTLVFENPFPPLKSYFFKPIFLAIGISAPSVTTRDRNPDLDSQKYCTFPGTKICLPTLGLQIRGLERKKTKTFACMLPGDTLVLPPAAVLQQSDLGFSQSRHREDSWVQATQCQQNTESFSPALYQHLSNTGVELRSGQVFCRCIYVQ